MGAVPGACRASPLPWRPLRLRSVEPVHEAPHAPWALRGELLLAFARRPRGAAVGGVAPFALPPGVAPLPGPVVIAATRYTASPVGPFVELRVGVPARIGLRPGLCDVLVVVSDPAAKVGMRCNWGFPADVGALTWEADGDERIVRWAERGIELRCTVRGARLPVVVPFRAVQRRGDGPVLVPRRVSALARLARAELLVSPDDPRPELAGLAGPHPAVALAAARFLVRPARHPLGLLSSFRAPLRAAEPGMSYRGPSATPARSGATAEALQ